jgi:hypothetical protein
MRKLFLLFFITFFVDVVLGQDTGLLVRTSCSDQNGIEVKKYWYLEKTSDKDAGSFEKLIIEDAVYKVYPFHIPQYPEELLIVCESCANSISENSSSFIDSLIENDKSLIERYVKLYEDLLKEYGDLNYDVFFSRTKSFSISAQSMEISFSKANIELCKGLVFIGYRYSYTDVYAVPKRLLSLKRFSTNEKKRLKHYASKLLSVKIVEEHTGCH